MSCLPAFACWAGPRHPRFLIVGEAWGREEEESRLSQPFVGEAGKELWRILGEAAPDLAPRLHLEASEKMRYGLAWVKYREPWLNASAVAFTNVLNFRPPGNNLQAVCCRKADLPHDYPSLPPIGSGSSRGWYLQPQYLPEIDRLFSEIEASNPNVIVAAGNTACWALLQSTNISSIRGNTTTTVGNEHIRGRKVLPTFHPANVLYKWSQRPIVVADLIKAFHEAAFPDIRRPHRSLIIQPTLGEYKSWVDTILANPPALLGNDLETTAGIIDTVGWATSPSSGIACQVGPHRIKKGTHYEYVLPIRAGLSVPNYFETAAEEIEFWRLSFSLLESPIPKCFQNGLYDLQYWLRMGVKPNNVTEDTMLLHHSLFPELPKSLGFLGSIYTSEASWKLMRRPSDTEKRDE